MKKVKRILLLFIAALLTVVLLYIAYVFTAGARRMGNTVLTVEGGPGVRESVKTGTAYTITSYNIGFGAYESDYGFFMDGVHSRGLGAASVWKRICRILQHF